MQKAGRRPVSAYIPAHEIQLRAFQWTYPPCAVAQRQNDQGKLAQIVIDRACHHPHTRMCPYQISVDNPPRVTQKSKLLLQVVELGDGARLSQGSCPHCAETAPQFRGMHLSNC